MDSFAEIVELAGQIGLVLFVLFVLVLFILFVLFLFVLVVLLMFVYLNKKINMQKDDKPTENREIVSSATRDTEEYFRDRLNYKMNVYDKLGDRYKWLFWSMTSISLICAAIVPVLINQDDYKVWATGLSLVVTIMVGLQGIFHPREHWRNYDMISATLRREEMLFSTKSGEYERDGDEDRFRLLVRRVEEFIAREREETIIMRTSENTDSTAPKNSS